MSKGIKRLVSSARKEVEAEISAFASKPGMYSGGLASEGYAGGYQDALDDVLLALNGVKPQRRGYWKTREEK